MNCKYIIKKPNGQELVIPAEFGIIAKNEEVEAAFRRSQKNDDMYPFIDTLDIITRGALAKETLSNIVMSDKNDLDQIIASVNSEVSDNRDYATFEQSLYKYLMLNNSQIEGLKADVKAPITKDYYKDIPNAGILFQTSIDSEHMILKSKISQSLEYGWSAEALSELDAFLLAVKRKDINLYQSQTLLANESTLGVTSTNIGNYTIISKDSYESLFLGLFKRMGNNISEAVLNKEFKDINYFKTTIGEDGAVNLSPFEQSLLETDEKKKKAIIAKASSVVANYLMKGDAAMKETVANLFVFLNPDVFVNENNEKLLKTQSFVKSESEADLLFQQKQRENYLDLVGSKMDENYTPGRELKKDTFNKLSAMLTMGEDLIKFPIGEFVTPYVLVTKITQLSNGNIKVDGYHKAHGTYRAITHEFKKGDTIMYRLKEMPIQKYEEGVEVIPVEESDSASISSKYLKTSFIKDMVRIGDVVNGNKLVTGVYPAHVTTETLKEYLNKDTGEKEKKKASIIYSHVVSIRSKKLKQLVTFAKDTQWEQLNKYDTISDPELLKEGDLIRDPFSKNNLVKVVLAVDENHVFLHFEKKPDANGNRELVIQKIQKSELKVVDKEGYKFEGRAYTFNTITESELDALGTNLIEMGGRHATMSTFKNYHTAKTGDFFSDGKIQGKILDHTTGRGVIMLSSDQQKESRIVNFFDIEGLTFHTNRNIASEYVIPTLRINGWKIHTDKSTLSNPVRVEYIIPKVAQTSDPNDPDAPKIDPTKGLFMMPSLYANKGQYKDMDKVDLNKETIVTDFVLEYINKSSDKKVTQLFIERESAGSYEYKKNLEGVNRVYYFDRLSTEVRKALKPIHQGVYFSVYKGGGFDFDIYRVSQPVNGDIVTAQVQRINSEGKLITIEKEFSLETLLTGKSDPSSLHTSGSISHLYLPYGNNNFNTIVAAINNVDTWDVNKVTEKKSIADLIVKMKKNFSELGIDVQETTEGFKNGQKARIETNINGDIKILLNTNEGKYSDLIHENLHIMLTLLRSQDLEEYDRLMKVMTEDNDRFDTKFSEDDDANLSAKEEFVVGRLITLLGDSNQVLYQQLRWFMKDMKSVVNKINPEYNFDINNFSDNPITFLNKTLREVYGLNTTNKSHPLYNSGILVAEPFMRVWMEENNIKLKCD